jgi:molecular chaperone HscC
VLIGIDLGTTNSVAGIWRDGGTQLVPNALGDFLTPSAVSVARDGTAYIGRAALDRLTTHPSETATSFKRMMGTERKLRLGGKAEYRAEDLSALVLASLRDDVAALCGEVPTEAVITVPAYFNDRQRKATRRAGELAGLTVRRLINEPTAAALAFGLQDRGDREPFLVFDLGGGTFDVSIVEMFEGIVEVRASAGDNRLGGDDFNHALTGLMRPRLDAERALEALPADKREALLTVAAERARKALSTAGQAEYSVTIGDEIYRATVTDEEFEAAAEPLLKRLRDPVIRALRDCSIDPAELSEIVLVGGATRMPAVRRALTRMFGRFPDSSVHPDHAVALGAAVQAGLLGRDAGLEEIRITDVAPFTLGIEVTEHDQYGQMRNGLFSPIIERNTPVPVSREHTYSTVADQQDKVDLKIYQGEARMVRDNVKLGEVSVPVPRRPRGQVAVNVRFSYDSSGLLEIDASVPDTGLTRNLVIADEEDRRDRKEFERRREALAALKFHPRDEAENVALMTRAARCYEGFTGEMREAIGHWIVQYEAALERQDPREIADARGQLAARLDQIEAQSPL